MPRHLILATAGHVDHGKSAIVKALSGVDPDRLPEEKLRGITIDLGFAELLLDAPDGQKFQIGIVDVPGHEDFVKNMVSGVGSADLALLVVAADDGWMPQTEEHLQILEYLGVRHGVIAFSKADLVAASDLTARMTKVRERLKPSSLADAPIVPTSIVTEPELASLRAALLDVVRRLTPSPDLGKPRLPVDRAFSLRGVGTVVTGTLAGGTLSTQQPVRVWSGGLGARIRSIQSHGRAQDRVGPGTRVALNLPDLHPRIPHEPAGRASIGRGDVLSWPGCGLPSGVVDVAISRSARLGANAPPLRRGVRLWLHHGSGAWPARVQLHLQRSIAPDQTALARIRLEPDQKILAFIGDRFVLRDWSGQSTLAGGIILDPHPLLPFARAMKADWLQRRSSAPFDPQVLVETEVRRHGAVPVAELLLQSPLDAVTIESATQQLLARRAIVLLDRWLCDANLWRQSTEAIVRRVDEHHTAHPEQSGIDASILRKVVADRLADADVFAALVAANPELQVRGSLIGRRTHRPALPARLRAAGDRIRRTLSERELDPPTRKELAGPDPAGQPALRFLLTTGEAVEISTELVLSAEAYAKAKTIIRQHLLARREATVSELKTALKSSRRIVVPLLEKLDRERFTLRSGDLRRLADAEPDA